jgi:hypothetical protein
MKKNDKIISKNKKEIDKNVNAAIEKSVEDAFKKSKIPFKKVK